MRKKDWMLIITIISVMIGICDAFILEHFVLVPYCLGKHIPVLEIKERYFEDEYIKERTEYFIDWERRKLWREIDSDFVVYARQHSIFGPIESSWLERKNGITGSCSVRPSGSFRWSLNEDVHIRGDVLDDTPLDITIFMGSDEDGNRYSKYVLDDTADSIKAFEEESGLDAKELLDTVQLIREEYRNDLNALSKNQYRKIILTAVATIWLSLCVWGIWVIICVLGLNKKKVYGDIYGLYMKHYEKKLDRYMQDFLEGENHAGRM